MKEFLNKLKAAKCFLYERGLHDCEFCHTARASGVLLFPCLKSGTIFISPAMIAHYIETHSYLPPQTYINAVLCGPKHDSSEYADLLEGLLDETEGGRSFLDAEMLSSRKRQAREEWLSHLPIGDKLGTTSCPECSGTISGHSQDCPMQRSIGCNHIPRELILKVVVRTAAQSADWMDLCAFQMNKYDIGPDEVNAELQRARESGEIRTTQSKMECISCQLQYRFEPNWPYCPFCGADGKRVV